MNSRLVVEDGLKKRILDSKGWVESNRGVEFPTSEFRGFPARLKVLEFIDDNRAERNGIRFRFIFGSESRAFFTDIEVRINARWFISEGKDDVAPYVVVYAINSNGSGDELHCFYIADQQQLKPELEVYNWYEAYIQRCIRPGDDKKIMTHRQTR